MERDSPSLLNQNRARLRRARLFHFSQLKWFFIARQIRGGLFFSRPKSVREFELMMTAQQSADRQAQARALTETGLTLEQAAVLVGTNHMTLSRWRRGKTTLQPWQHARLMSLIVDMQKLRGLFPGVAFNDVTALRAALRDLRAGRFDMLAPAAPGAGRPA